MKTVIIENKEQVEEIISRCDICFVGITDLEGNPYVIPMNFGYQDGVIYLHSGPTGSSIDMLARNNRVCITFSVDHELVFQHPKVACSYRMRAKSVICRGRVNFIEDPEESAAYKMNSPQITPIYTEFSADRQAVGQSVSISVICNENNQSGYSSNAYKIVDR